MKLETDRIVSLILAVVAFVIVSAIFGSLIGIGSAVLAYLFGTEIYTFAVEKYKEFTKKS